MLLAILTLDACKESNKTPSQPPQKEVNSDKKAALQCIMSRASCRVFQHKEVEKETIETLLRAAMAAPS